MESITIEDIEEFDDWILDKKDMQLGYWDGNQLEPSIFSVKDLLLEFIKSKKGD